MSNLIAILKTEAVKNFAIDARNFLVDFFGNGVYYALGGAVFIASISATPDAVADLFNDNAGRFIVFVMGLWMARYIIDWIMERFDKAPEKTELSQTTL